MLKTLILTAAATFALAGAAMAQDAGPRTPDQRARIDADGDRRVSLAEMQAAHAQRFARLDIDRDGQLTREERQAGRRTLRAERAGNRAQRRAAAFSRRDVDRDGALTPAEAPKRLAERFTQFDGDRNGRLTAQELQAGRVAIRGERGPRASGGERVRADTNGDRVITRAESEAQVRARFARMDSNQDGFLTRDERRAHRQQRRGQA